MHIDDPLLNIRRETEQDMAFLAQLYRSTREDLMQLGLPEAMIGNLIEMQFNAQQSSYRKHFPNAEYSIVGKAGDPIGRLITNYGDAAIRLIYLALLPQERNQGQGRRLLQALQAVAAKADIPLTLSVDAENVQARRLYDSLGFQVRNDDGVKLEMIWHAEERHAVASRDSSRIIPDHLPGACS